MDLLERIKDAGVIGAGGAGFPTHVKLASKADYILMNAAECEPLSRADQAIMAQHPDELVKGFKIAKDVANADHGIIGIKGSHPELIQLIRERITANGLDGDMEVGILPDIYPAGDEHVIVHELTGRVVPETAIPIAAGCIVINAETSYNCYRASEGKPVTEKFCSVVGDVPNRFTALVPVGTPVETMLKMAGVTDFSNIGVIDGGPMMGRPMKEIGGSVKKNSKAYVVLKKDHRHFKRKSISLEAARRVDKTSCEQCRMCTDLCPRHLLGHNLQPHMSMRVMNYNLKSIQLKETAQLCSSCGLCEYFSCPIGLYPKSANDVLKAELMEQGVKYKPTKTEFKALAMRPNRLIPSKRLIARLGLTPFNKPAPFIEIPESEIPEVKIMIRQNVGAAPEVIVAVGDHVEAGQMIGKIPEGKLSAPIHASISGTVTDISPEFITIRRG